MFEMSFQTEREMLFLERNRYIQVCRENEYAVLYILSDELLQKGQKDLKTQKMIIYLWTLISVVILWIFYPVSYTHLDVYKRQLSDGGSERELVGNRRDESRR